MEIKATLNKPYTESQRIDFIVNQNHKLGYEIRETDTALEAWGADDEELLAQAKSAKKAELTTARDSEESKNVTTAKGTFEFDSLSRQRLQDAMNTLPNKTTYRNWSTVDGVVVEMKYSDFNEIFTNAIARSDENFAKLQTLKTKVDACTTVEEVQAIKWEE